MELDPELEYICHMLEERGATDEEIDEFLEHSGVKGMKWGVRKTKRQQGQVDRLAKVRDGNATKVDRLRVANRNLVFSAKGADKTLKRSAKFQDKVAKGESIMGKLMFKHEKKRLADLDFHADGTVGSKASAKSGSDKRKVDAGKASTAAILATTGVLGLAVYKVRNRKET